MKAKTLDYHLKNILIHLRDSDNDTKGVVAAALVDGNQVTYATSEKKEKETWLHAERNALETHVANYGLPTEHAIMVVSLSPCIKELDVRYGDSCSSLLLGQDDHYSKVQIKRIHVGVVDTLQGNEEEYDSSGFTMTLTADTKLKAACHRLFEYFSPDIYGKVSIPHYLQEVLKDV